MTTQVTSGVIADGSVTTNKIADGSVTTEKIATGAVVTADLADLSVTTEKIAAGAATLAKLDTTGATGRALRSNGSGVTPSWVLAQSLETTKNTGTNGFVYLPGGLILAWGQVTVGQDSTATITWPVPGGFPNACLQCVANYGVNMGDGQSGQDPFVSVYNLTTTQATVQQANNVSATVRWMAIGF